MENQKHQIVFITVTLICCSCLLQLTQGQGYIYDRPDPTPYLPNRGHFYGGYDDTDDYTYEYNEEDQQDLTCEQRDSCSDRWMLFLNARDVHLVNCFCDDRCQIYDDCCKDFVQTSSNHFYESMKLHRSLFTCRHVDGVDGYSPVYVVDSCPKNFSDSQVKRSCERDTPSDVFANVPVNGNVSGIMYKNFYCSICNGEKNYLFWIIDVGCNNQQEGIDPTSESFNVEDTIVTLLSSQNNNCSLSFNPPEGHSPRFCKQLVISKCSENWTDKRIKRKCRAYKSTSYKYRFQWIFRNEFCAQCNYQNTTYLECSDHISPHVSPPDEETKDFLQPFSLLLDVNFGTGNLKQSRVGVGNILEKVESSVDMRQCNVSEIYDPFARKCRLVHCMQGKVFRNGGCVSDGSSTQQPTSTVPYINSTTSSPAVPPTIPTLHVSNSYLHPATDKAVTPHESILNSVTSSSLINTTSEARTRYDIIYMDCPLVTIPQEDYHVFNQTVYIPIYEHYYNTSEYINDTNGDIMVCAPSNQRNYTVMVNTTHRVEMFKFDRIQGLVSYIGLIISVVCLFVVFVIYMIFPVLRNIAGKCVLCLVVSLLMAQLSFMVGGPLTDYYIACFVLAVLVHLFSLCAFCWMNVLSVDILKIISSTTTRSESDSNCFIYYSLYAWLTPTVLVGVTLTIEFVGGEEIQQFKAMYGDGICWITQRWALLLMFAAPVALILVVNIIIYIITTVKIGMISRAARYLHADKKDRNSFLLYIKLCIIMGLTWVFGFIAALTELQFLWYVFIVFNTLQGAFICFAFVCNRNVFRLLSGKGKKKKVATMAPYYGNTTHNPATNSWNRTKNTVLDTSYNGDARVIESRETSI